MNCIPLIAEITDKYELMWTVTASGILIVFGVLLLLVFVFYLFGVIMKKTSNKNSGSKKKDKKTVVEVKKNSAEAPKAQKNASPAPVVEAGISPEVVAAISAAIAYSEGGASYTIKSIKRQKNRQSGRPAWAMAGIADNTRPF